jgi:hypothetical protein
MAKTEFAIEYEGPVLADGSMPVADLGAALLALGEVFVQASRTAYPDLEPVSLNIRATETGSFLAQLALHSPDVWEHIVHLLSSPTADALSNIKDLVIGSGVGLFFLVKRLRNRRITQREPLEAGRVRLTLEDGTTIEIPANVLALYESEAVRERLRRVVEPIERPGMERMSIISDGEVTVVVERSDVPAFDVPEPEEIALGEYEHDSVVAVATVSFAEAYKWRFTEGDSAVFTASIEDASFRKRIDDGEAFQKGDTLRCKMRVVQTQRGDTLHVERTVIQVTEHIPRGTQLHLEDPEQD